jgi:hypothetical protein
MCTPVDAKREETFLHAHNMNTYAHTHTHTHTHTHIHKRTHTRTSITLDERYETYVRIVRVQKPRSGYTHLSAQDASFDLWN